MTCPNCGAEIPDDSLLCESCGEEIRMVPDYDPSTEVRTPKAAAPLESAQDDETGWSVRNIASLCIAAILIVIAIVAIIVIIFKVKGSVAQVQQQESSSEQDESEEDKLAGFAGLLESGDLDEAEAWLEANKESLTGSDVVTLELALASAYEQTGDDEKLAVWLETVLCGEHDNVSAQKLDNYYEWLVLYLDTTQQYDRLIALLDRADSRIRKQYSKYYASDPVFSYEGGSYTQDLALKLSVQEGTDADIYYTLDGNPPSEDSTHYVSPIFMGPGTYTVNAICVNKYGISGSIVTKTYTIEVTAPAPPQVLPYTAELSHPAFVQVTVPEGCIVYYTSDGSAPTTNSTVYDKPFPIPLGQSSYRFIAVNSDGLISDVETRDYYLELVAAVPIDVAQMGLSYKLLTMRQEDPFNAGNYAYEFRYAINVEDMGDFYIFAELVATSIDEVTMLPNYADNGLYAVSTEDGTTYRYETQEAGGFALIAF